MRERMNVRDGQYLRPTPFIDCDHPSIGKKAGDLTAGTDTTPEKAKRLFYFVRDSIKYNPYAKKNSPEFYITSRVLSQGEGFCIQKAALLCSLARAAGIPSRLGYADIRNHIVPGKMGSMNKTHIFVFHGYTEFFIDGKWVKATPAFDIYMCEKHNIIPVEFDGKNDAVFHKFNKDGNLHIEYINDLGRYSDIPYEDIRKSFTRTYGSADSGHRSGNR
jgi:transglutaminase-like putative cysteine protease